MLRSFAAAAVVACAGVCASPPPGNQNDDVDDAGRPIPRDLTAARIVSLAPSITELLFDLGLEESVVGRTRWCDYPPQVERIPSVGDGLSPNVELIMERQPDLVVFYASGSNEAAVSRLEGLHVATVSLRTDRLGDLERAARILGRLTGTGAIGDSLIAELEQSITEPESTRSRDARISVLILPSESPPIAVGAASFLSEIVTLAGGRNVFDDVEKPSFRTDIEVIAQRDPDAVLVTSEPGIPEWANLPEWRSVRAVRDRRFVLVTGSEFSRPSFRAPMAVRRLRAAFEAWQH